MTLARREGYNVTSVVILRDSAAPSIAERSVVEHVDARAGAGRVPSPRGGRA